MFEKIQYHFLNRNKKQEKEDKDQWTIAKSASMLLHFLSKICGIQIIEFVSNFFQNFFNNEDLYIKDSVIMSIGSVLDTIHSQKIKEIIVNVFPLFLNLFDEKTIFLRSTSAWAIKKICEKHIDCVIYICNNSPEILNLFQGVILKNLNSMKRIALHFIDCITHIPEKSKEFYQNNHKNSKQNYQNFSEENFEQNNELENLFKTSIISNNYETYLNSLLSLCFKGFDNNEYNVSNCSFYALSQLIEFCPLDCVDTVNNFFPQLINNLNWVNSNITNLETRYFYEENIFSLILTYIQKKSKNFLNFSEEQYFYLYEICERSFNERQIPFLSGIYLLGNLLKISYDKDFNSIKEKTDNIIKWIFIGMSNWEIKEICYSSIDAFGDLVENLPNVIFPHVDYFLNKIFEIGMNSYIDKSIKLVIINLYCDIYFSDYKINNEKNSKIFESLNTAMQACIMKLDLEEMDSDEIEYYQKLKIAVLECLSALIVRYKENNEFNKLWEITGILKIVRVIGYENLDDLEIVSIVLGIFIDFYEIFRAELSSNLEDIEKFYVLIKNSDIEGTYSKILLWTESVIKR